MAPKGQLNPRSYRSVPTPLHSQSCFKPGTLWDYPPFLKKYIYLLIMLLQLSHFPPFTPLHPAHPFPPTFPPYNSCPWVIHISSLASTFPILFLTSPCLFSTYHLCFLFPVPFLPFFLLPFPAMWSPFLWLCSCSSCLLSLFCFCFL